MNKVKQIIIEEISKLADEGVGDKYAERKFNIPDDQELNYQRQTASAVQTPEMGKLAGYIKNYGTGRVDINEPIFVNPQNLSKFEPDVRAVTDKNGNLYVALNDGNFTHGQFSDAVKVPSVYYLNTLTWHRVGSTNKFTLADSSEEYVDDERLALSTPHKRDYITKEVNSTLNAAKRKNPQFEFSLETYYDGNQVRKIIKEEIEKYTIREEFENGTLYGYHCTPCENIDSIKLSGFKVGTRNMQGNGVYGFYDLRGGSGNAAVGYGQRHVNTKHYCIVKFKITDFSNILILKKHVAEEVLGDKSDIMSQFDKLYGGYDNFYEKLRLPFLKPEYVTANDKEETKQNIIRDFERNSESDQKNILWGYSARDIVWDLDGIIFNGEYGLQYIMKNTNLMIPVGYHEVNYTDKLTVSDLIPF